MFLSSSAPLPQNSLDPPPQWEVDLSARQVAADSDASRTGRERVYSTLPALDSFFSVSPGLARDAAYVIPASETARQAVLNGIDPYGYNSGALNGNASTAGGVGPDGAPVFGQAPTVYSLNAPSGQLVGQSEQVNPAGVIMPPPAPVPSQYGYLDAGSVPALRSGKLDMAPKNPGCSRGGLGAYAPPWGDAFETVSAAGPNAQTGSVWLVLGLLGAGLVGLKMFDKRRR